MKIIGEDVRPGEEFRFTTKPRNAAAATFVTVANGDMVVTRRATDLFSFKDDHPVLAHWHGERRTDGFRTTVGELKRKADEYNAQFEGLSPKSRF